jgi:LytS/YehU family sensor histidine kinase
MRTNLDYFGEKCIELKDRINALPWYAIIQKWKLKNKLKIYARLYNIAIGR